MNYWSIKVLFNQNERLTANFDLVKNNLERLTRLAFRLFFYWINVLYFTIEARFLPFQKAAETPPKTPINHHFWGTARQKNAQSPY